MVITNSGLWADLIVPCELHGPTPAAVDRVDTQPALDQGASSQGIGKQTWRILVLVWIVFKERRCKFENYFSLWNREWRKQMDRKRKNDSEKSAEKDGGQWREEMKRETWMLWSPHSSWSWSPSTSLPPGSTRPYPQRMCSPSNESSSFGIK